LESHFGRNGSAAGPATSSPATPFRDHAAIPTGKAMTAERRGIDPHSLAPVFGRYPIIAAYLFGSQAAGRRTALSDVDVAVLLDAGTVAPGRVQARLISDLMLVLKRSDVDVVVLNDAHPLLKQRAISGLLLYSRDEKTRVRFEVATLREYVETRPLRDAQDQALLDRYARSP